MTMLFSTWLQDEKGIKTTSGVEDIGKYLYDGWIT